MRKVKIAFIGLNSYSHSVMIYESILKQSELFEVVGYCCPENEAEYLAHKMYVFEGLRELTLDEILNNPEIEAVAIETDEIYLTKYALLCAKAGKHIHMEKPGGQNEADFEALVSEMKKSGKVFHIGYMYRYNSMICEVIRQAKNGELGTITAVEAQMNGYQGLEMRKWLKDFKGGMMFFLGCHLIDLIMQILGEPQNVVPFNRSLNMGADAEDLSLAVLEYKNAFGFAKSNALEVGGFARRQLVVAGTKKTVEIKPLEMFCENDLLYTEKCEYPSLDWDNTKVFTKSEKYDRYDNMMKAFAEYVTGEKQNPFTLDYELALYKTILKACGV